MGKSDRTKEGIVQSAIELFRDKGYYNTSIDEIVNRAGIAKGTYYYYFKQKDDVLLKIINNDFNKYFESPEQIAFSDKYNAVEKLEKVLNSLFSAPNSPSGIEHYFSKGIPRQFKAAIDEIRVNKLLPLVNKIIKQGNFEKKFDVVNVEIVASIMTRGITGHVDSVFSDFNEICYLKKTIEGIEEFINNTLKTKERLRIKL
ncbi:TetR family transcriptional regulator [Dethiothermospora halolimnae]|uniref:TetR/AcrR family transcriptional regulator n=1 Tax=Dethiothermospora halolimnae TaxID=3114390 RepID=UPI003CCC3E27